MNQVPIKFDVKNTMPGKSLGLRVWLDQQVVIEKQIGDPCTVQVDIVDEEAKHVMEIELFGKTNQHTTIDTDGNILTDSSLEITNFNVDDIELDTHILGEYTHDFNGNGQSTTEKFFGIMGCNGRVRVEFSTPVYLWLLEKM